MVDVALVLSIWGALLSTALAGLRVWEISQKGPKLRVRHHFTPSRDTGNTITIENVSATPAMISYWRLVWAKVERGRFIEGLQVGSPDARREIETLIIPAHDSRVLRFTGDEHFGWGTTTSSLGCLYLLLRIPGRNREQKLLVYNPNAPIA